MDVFSYVIGRKSGGGGNSPGGGGGGGGGGSNEDWIIGDGNTHLWITLPEGRTSPMLGIGVNGTVTVDWGDGTEPDVLTAVNLSNTQWTPIHNYAMAGDYVITLIANGELRVAGQQNMKNGTLLLRHASTPDGRNTVYQNALKKVELGNNARLGTYPFTFCYGIKNIFLPANVGALDTASFANCYNLAKLSIPDGTTQLATEVFRNCYNLSSVSIPNSVQTIKSNAFGNCYSLGNVVIPSSVNSIASNAFKECTGLAVVDFTHHTSVPTLAATDAFYNIPADCIFKIPASLYDEWVAATNWSAVAATYTFVGV